MEFKAFDLGLIDFQQALSLQKQIHLKVKEGLLEGALIICSHYPVMTAGRRAKKESLLVLKEKLKERGVSLCQVERGGDITYHGPGQLTAYPIFNLGLVKKDIHLFLRELEEVVVSFLMDLGIAAERRYGLTGVWIGNKKIASVGISIKNWITFHGLTINIKSNDLENFRLIKPCGMDIEMTSVEDILGVNLEIADLKGGLVEKFNNVFCLREALT